MKIRKRMLILLLAVLALLLLTGCTKIGFVVDRLDNAAFVRNAASIANNHLEIKEWLSAGDNILIDLEQDPVFEPFYYLKNFKATVDKDDDSIVHYSCKLPGLVGSAFNIAYERCFYLNEKFSPWVNVEGDLHIIKDEDGSRKIDISEGDNVFAVYAAMRYMNPLVLLVNGLDVSGGIPDGKETDVLDLILNLGAQMYAGLNGVSAEEYSETVVMPELENYIANLSTISKHITNKGYRLIDRLTGISSYDQLQGGTLLVAAFFGLFILVWIGIGIYSLIEKLKPVHDRKEYRKKWKKYYNDLDQDDKWLMKPKKYKALLKNDREAYPGYDRREAAEKLSYPEDRGFLLFLIENDEDKDVRKTALQKLPYPEEKKNLRRYAEDRDLGETAVEMLPYKENKDIILRQAKSGMTAAVEKLPYPEEKKAIAHIAINTESYSAEKRALQKLQYPADRELITDYLLQRNKHQYNYQNDDTFDLFLPEYTYPENREDLIRMAKEANAPYVRICAISKLPYPEEEETLNYVLDNDRDKDAAAAALKVIEENSKNPEEILIYTALNGKDPETRRNALKKLEYPKHEEVYLHAAQKDADAENRLEALKALEDFGHKGIDKLYCDAALHDKSRENRTFAIKKLIEKPTPEKRNTLAKIAKNDKDAENRHLAIESFTFPRDRQLLVRIAQNDQDVQNRALAREKLPFLEEPAAYAHPDLLESKVSDTKKIKAAIAFTVSPNSSEKILRSLCEMIQDGFNTDPKDKKLTIAGWAAAALGRILTAEMTPDDIKPNWDRFGLAISHFHEIAEKARTLQKDLRKYDGKNVFELPQEGQQKYFEMLSLQGELEHGLGICMLDNGDKPFSYLVHILRDNTSRVPRFIKQGIIMGLLDWLMENQNHPEAGELLKSVVDVRADLIRSDNDLSFFEVRVPEDCTQNEYAELLKMVLHSANPTIRYCSTNNLLELAEHEVPGCLEMLRACPLRIIDPVNQRTLGFYKFDPYIHAMWVQYQPPMNTGQVISRYHEVDDRTRPLSSGLNLKLFRDIYSVIPTLFHEYQHFSGDPNEASVFLKTQVFSIGFYQRNPKAKASGDAVFARLGELLGLPPTVDKCTALNALIKEYYGKQTDKDTATASANNELEQLNARIMTINMRETWDPSVKFPLLTENEDQKNMNLIRDIIVRYNTTPKSITKEDFRKIIANVTMISSIDNNDNNNEDDDDDEGHRPD